ncbi:MAG: ATP-binding protein [Microcoleaceae cyanobacterium]
MAGNQLVVQSHLQVQTELHALEEVLQWLETFFSPVLPERLIWDCKVLLAEGFTNAVRHAHRALSEKTPIDVEVAVFPKCVEMRIWDQGQPFDLDHKLDQVKDLHIDPLAHEGKRGLIFMSKLADELRYDRTEDNRNCLLMRKKL